MKSEKENKKFRVLVLNYEFPPLGGGASPVSYEVIKRLVAQERYIADVVTMGYKDLPAYEEIIPGLKVYRVKGLRSKKEICYPHEQLTYLASAFFRCRQLLRKSNYDICHAHFLIPTGILAWVLKKRYKLKYVITSHGSDVPGYNEDRFTFLHKFTGPILKLVARGAKKIITPSKYLGSLILNNIDSTLEDKIEYIPNGIDIDRFIPAKKRNIILSTGRLLPRKGFQYLIQAVSDLIPAYEVHICGDGPMMPELKKLAEKSNTKIIFHGWVDNDSDQYK